VGTGEYADEEDVLKLLSKLVDKSLVVAELRVGYVGRYRMLKSVRQYAWDACRRAEKPKRFGAGTLSSSSPWPGLWHASGKYALTVWKGAGGSRQRFARATTPMGAHEPRP
jgi:hypothetical protein